VAGVLVARSSFVGPAGHLAARWPFEEFQNRASFHWTGISFAIAAQRVAWGVLPPGLVHKPFAAIASIKKRN
jgi:hypothetical protein